MEAARCLQYEAVEHFTHELVLLLLNHNFFSCNSKQFNSNEAFGQWQLFAYSCANQSNKQVMGHLLVRQKLSKSSHTSEWRSCVLQHMTVSQRHTSTTTALPTFLFVAMQETYPPQDKIPPICMAVHLQPEHWALEWATLLRYHCNLAVASFSLSYTIF